MLLTYEQQLALVQQKLATVSTNGNLSTFKYAKRVMYDYLWDRHPELKECRGHTYDNTNGKLVLAAPTKTFNYLENGTWKDVLLDTRVILYKKYNGFMATATLYNDELIVGTTGSTKSEFARWAREMIILVINRFPEYVTQGITTLFEIIVPQDPHIVDEANGAYLLGVRRNETGEYYPCGGSKVCTLKEALELCTTDRGEGWMMYDTHGNVCKLKTDYYVGKKKLIRMSEKSVHNMYDNPFFVQQSLPLQWEEIVENIVDAIPKEQWIGYNPQERRKIIEEIHE